ncbi:hypothetical protein DNTS_011620 [Danionella cerebrum]|uniref:Endoplasmic reticulum resident protein 27 n=1 Tax=Danionella cerebrum TaxID=2873325 RepID=A0A553NMP1_9TELE|nr:hypothetical protein DNTS_011620 [Danionella translucida]
MPPLLLLALVSLCVTAEDQESTLLRLDDVSAAEAFIDGAEVSVIGFFQNEAVKGYKEFVEAARQMKEVPVALCSEQEVWAKYGIPSDTISLFRKEHFTLSGAKKVDTEGFVRFMIINNLRFVTEYNQASAVGLFQSPVKTHLLLITDRGHTPSDPLQELFRENAKKYAGKQRDLPRIGIYDVTLDRKWLMAPGEISTERVQNFCNAFLDGELQKQNEAGFSEDRTEL